MKLVIVDRDGTLCVEREGYLQTPDDWAPLPGALDAIARLNHAGYQVVIAQVLRTYGDNQLTGLLPTARLFTQGTAPH